MKLTGIKYFPAFVFLISIAVYLPTLTGTFYYDDRVIFFGHQAKNLSENPFEVFTKGAHDIPGAPRSLHVFFLLILYKAFGASPLPYHLFNLLFHAGTALLLYIFLRRVTDSPYIPLLGGLIFGLHPVHVENITFVTLGGTDLFYLFWGLLSLVLYVLFRQGYAKGIFMNYGLLALSVLAYIFALLSKEAAVSFILVYPLTEVLLKKKGWLWGLPHLLVLAAFKWNVVFGGAEGVATAMSGAQGQAMGRGPEDVILSLGFFIKSLILPYPLSPLIKEMGPKWLMYGAIALAAFGTAIGIIFRNKLTDIRLAAFGGIFFLVVALPYLFVPLIEFNVAITAERYIYAPSMGFAILASALLSAIKREKVMRLVSIGLLTAYSAIGVGYFMTAWRSEEAFWRYSAKMNPDYVSAYVSLAGARLEAGDPEAAKAILLDAIKKPKGMPAEFAQAGYVLGTISLAEGNQRLAESYYLLSIRYSPYEFSFIDLGVLYLNQKRFDEAKWSFENALRFPAQNTRAVLGLAKAFEGLGDKEKARELALRAYNRARDEELRAIAAQMLR